MERRHFFQTALASAAGLALLPRVAGGTEKSNLENVIFSEDSPGHWKGKEKLHVPRIEIRGDSMTVTTPHPMSEAHFIVSHSVVLQGGQLLGRKTFTWKDAPISTYMLPAGFKGRITVTSTCNQHDWWINEHAV